MRSLKKIIPIVIFVILLIGGLFKTVHASEKIYFFYGKGCPHCAEVEDYFTKKGYWDKYNIEKKEIYFDRQNAQIFNSIMEEHNIPQTRRGVPVVVIGSEILIGDKPIIDNFVDMEVSKEKTPHVTENNQKSSITLAAVIIGALVDAINPCEFAVLIILMTTILASGKAKSALLAGISFSASIFISYLLMGIGIYKALSIGSGAAVFLTFIGWLAIILGLANLKDYFWYGRGFLMEVPLSWRPKLKSLIHSVTNPVGAFFIGFVVSLFLLPCTSGPYIVILGMLAKNAIDAQAVFYLILYNLIFVSPMLIITAAVYKGFNPQKAEDIRQKRLKLLHLIAGIVLLGMGIALVTGLL